MEQDTKRAREARIARLSPENGLEYKMNDEFDQQM